MILQNLPWVLGGSGPVRNVSSLWNHPMVLEEQISGDRRPIVLYARRRRRPRARSEENASRASEPGAGTIEYSINKVGANAPENDSLVALVLGGPRPLNSAHYAVQDHTAKRPTERAELLDFT